MNPEIHVGPLEGGRLVQDYLDGDERLQPFFFGAPFDPAAYRRKADEVRDRFGPAALEAMAHSVRTLSQGAAEKLDAIARGAGFFVTTGQQPGLFGGPLYTVHKALSALALARRLEGLLGVPVLALFWVASDDHDWGEANHTHFLDAANEIRRLELPGTAEPARSMGRRTLGDGIETTLDELAQVLPPSEFVPGLLDALRQDHAPRARMADAFAGTVGSWLAGLDLGLVDAQHETVRRLGRPVLERELTALTAGEPDPLATQSERLEALGYDAQVPVQPGAAHVFHEDEEHGRERLVRDRSGWLLRASRRRLSDAELRSRFDAEPERFSPNVVLRPVVESTVFPTLAYVGGPGEVRYLAQTGELFRRHGVGMPLVFPRFSVTLVEGKVRKVLDKFELGLESFGGPVHELIQAVVRDDVPPGVTSRLGQLRESILSGYEALYNEARTVDPTLKGPIFNARNEALRAIGDLEKKIVQHVKLREETTLEQIEKAASNLTPLGRPQERVLNPHHFLARYGTGLIPVVLEALVARLAEQWPERTAASIMPP